MNKLLLDTIYQGDSLSVLKTFPDESIDCCITSPPYWSLRDYGVEGQLGLEKTPEEYVAKMVEVFREVKRVLKKEGTLWLNLGDSYASDTKSGGRNDTEKMYSVNSQQLSKHINIKIKHGLKPKDLAGIPWRVAFALQADGWYLRQDIIWAKPNPMPESVQDRCTKSHEYIFLMSKSPKYYFDNEAIKEKAVWDLDGNGTIKRAERQREGLKSNPTEMKNGIRIVYPNGKHKNGQQSPKFINGMHNKRSVWTVTTKPFSGVKLLTDYVSADGTPYTASLDCPIYEHHLCAQIRQKGQCGEPLNPEQLCNLGKQKNLFEVTVDESVSTHVLDVESQTMLAGNQKKNPQNISENRISESSLDKDGFQNHRGNKNIQGKSAYNLDSSRPVDSKIAISHNKKNCKKSSLKVLDDKVSDKISSDKSDKKLSVFSHNLSQNKSENNTSEDCASNETEQFPSEQIVSGNNDISYSNGNKAICSCQEATADHFATFPEDLIVPMVKAGCPKEGIILDCFMGAGTTGLVAKKLGRNYVGIELNLKYIEIAEKRINNYNPLL